MVRCLLEVHANALALAGTAHLARLQAYSSSSWAWFPKGSLLKTASGLPFRRRKKADTHLWSRIFQLVIEKSWQLNDAIYAYTEIRGDMASWLQPRAKVSSALPRRPQGHGVRTTALPSQVPVGAQAKAKVSRGVRCKAPKEQLCVMGS